MLIYKKNNFGTDILQLSTRKKFQKVFSIFPFTSYTVQVVPAEISRQLENIKLKEVKKDGDNDVASVKIYGQESEPEPWEKILNSPKTEPAGTQAKWHRSATLSVITIHGNNSQVFGASRVTFGQKKYTDQQGCGAGAGRSRNFWLEPELEPVY